MEPTAIVFNRQWTNDCIRSLDVERKELNDLYRMLSSMRSFFDMRYISELNSILHDIKKLESSISVTYSIMNQYMSDMDNAINVIAEKIEIANAVGPKVME